jgi:2-iminobutanoate/2-iminopropanoate deaminase
MADFKMKQAKFIRMTLTPKSGSASKAVRRTLEKAGGSLDDIVTMTVFVTDMANGTRFTQLRRQFFKEDHYPASALIGIKALARPAMMVEIQGIAVVE